MAARSDNLVLELRRVLPAPPPLVFAAFTDPKQLARWWGPKELTVSSLSFRARVGEQYRIEMQPPTGNAFSIDGEFRGVDPPARLAYTFAYENPDVDDVETLVEMTFRDLDGSTAVAFMQGPFKTAARLELHRNGWTDSFDKLEQFISAKR